MKTEISGDLDGCMEGLSEGVQYHIYAPYPAEPTVLVTGKAAVRSRYESNLKSGTVTEHVIDVVVVDDDHVVTGGVLRRAVPGHQLEQRGIGGIDDPDARYLYEARVCVVWPFDNEGKILGENAYFAADGYLGIVDRKIPSTAERDVRSSAP